jgi:TPR repeat protein
VGKGVPVDFIEAYFWLDLAAALGSDAQDQQQWVKSRDDIAAHLTSAQLAQVQERARNWFAAHQPNAR